MKELLTHSRMQAFRMCPKKHEYRYIDGYVPIESAWALQFGTIIHSLIEQYWKLRKDDKAWETPIAQSIKPDVDPFERVKACVLFEAYMTVWNMVDCKVLAIEKEFRLPLLDPRTGRVSRRWDRAGKIDVFLEMGGLKTLCEHKSSAMDVGPGTDYRRRLTLDEQISFYENALRDMNMRPDKFIYDVIGKPRIEPLLATPMDKREYTKESSRACKECKKKNAAPAPHVDPEIGVACKDGRVITDPGGKLYANMRANDETPEEYEKRLIEKVLEDPMGYIERVEITRSEMERAKFELNVWQQSQLMLLAMDTENAPMNSDSCLRYGSPCDYMDVCEGTTSLKNPLRFRKLKHLHPELAVAGQEDREKAG